MERHEQNPVTNVIKYLGERGGNRFNWKNMAIYGATGLAVGFVGTEAYILKEALFYNLIQPSSLLGLAKYSAPEATMTGCVTALLFAALHSNRPNPEIHNN